ncbi:TonB-dependent receptor [Rhodobacteraceae bacterium GS-10]|uniref:TonB-dependent receptor n=1 Tax=Thalassovita mangrovi TaxID=2692236 RepID=A0A6L8LNS1_9RHOB|nr:TonB-dependent receptor [Thalassovita mangrovi]
MPGSFAYRQSAYNHFDTEQQSVGWELTHEFTPDLTFNQRLRYAHQTTDYAQLDFGWADATGLNYYAFRNDEDAKTLGIDNTLEWKSVIGSADNSLIIGADYQRSRSDVTQYLDYTIYTVPYADPSLDFAVADPALSSMTRSTYTEKGLYVQDHVKFANGTTLTGGLRHSWFEIEVEDLSGGGTQWQENDATTGMIGLTHDFANGLTPYASYTEGFIQNVGTTLAGDPLKPSESKQWEAGLRYQPNSALMLSAAIFDLRKTNVKEYDLNDPTWSSFTQAGEVRSRGLELEARGAINSVLQGVFSYSYLDSEVTKSTDASIVGNENSMSPNHQAAIWLDYDAAAIAEGLTIGGGLRYVSSFYATQSNGRVTPSYTLADLAVSYEVSDFTLDLNVTNLFDRDYYGNCYDSYGCSKGEGRTITVTLNRSF